MQCVICINEVEYKSLKFCFCCDNVIRKLRGRIKDPIERIKYDRFIESLKKE